MNLKPLPCPFCGSSPTQGMTKVQYCQLHGDPYQHHTIGCTHGCAKFTGATKEQAISQWNRRAPANTDEGKQ